MAVMADIAYVGLLGGLFGVFISGAWQSLGVGEFAVDRLVRAT